MSIFKKVLNKLGIGKKKEEAAPPEEKKTAKASSSRIEAPKRPSSTSAPKRPTSAKQPLADKKRRLEKRVTGSASAAVPMVDVMSKLETMAAGTKLDWKVSIVDLLKVLDIDSSLAARKELANELGCPPDLIGGDYAEMNVWLHKKVLAEIAANGGNIPQELLD
jgi:hypothetical protein